MGAVDIIGNSMGGAVALSIAVARPRAVRRVVLMGSMGAAMALPPGLNAVWGNEPARSETAISPRQHGVIPRFHSAARCSPADGWRSMSATACGTATGS